MNSNELYYYKRLQRASLVPNLKLIRMLQAILNKSWRQHPTRHQLYGHLSPIMKTIQVRRTRHAGYCWRSRDELISDVLLWTPTYGRAKAGRPARTYIQQLCEDSGCSLEDLPEAMNDREKWRERVRDICATSTTWWWWWWWLMSLIISWGSQLLAFCQSKLLFPSFYILIPYFSFNSHAYLWSYLSFFFYYFCFLISSTFNTYITHSNSFISFILYINSSFF